MNDVNISYAAARSSSPGEPSRLNPKRLRQSLLNYWITSFASQQ